SRLARRAPRRRPSWSEPGPLRWRRSPLDPECLFLAVQRLLELAQSLLRLLRGRRLSVEAEGVLHQRHAAALLRLADDRGRTLALAAPHERLHDRLHVVPVDLDRVPLESLELLADVLEVHDVL